MGSAGSAIGICTSRDGEEEPSKKVLGPAVPRPPSAHGIAEPDAEPDEHAEHAEFVKVLRTERAKEEEAELWSLSDLTDEAVGPKCRAIRRAVEELRIYYNQWSDSGHDVFWHRKSHQVVLAVAVCQAADGTLTPFRGMNTEVSLPAGSLCAERAAIARLASDLRNASELSAVAVLDPVDKINPLWPCEVCQSWLAKLKDQCSAICVVAVKDSSCQEFLVRVNGILQPRPRAPAESPPEELVGRVRLGSDVDEQPWQARTLVYVDGAWDQLGADQFALLKAARAKGTHLLAGVYSDQTIQRELGVTPREPLDVRVAKVREDRHVSSVLVDAPWALSDEFIRSLGIQRVVTESKTAERRKKWCTNAYEAARKKGLVETVTLQ